MFSCKCGHKEEDHKPYFFIGSISTYWCGGCSKENRFGRPLSFENMFHDVALDNLSIIEKLATEKGLI